MCKKLHKKNPKQHILTTLFGQSQEKTYLCSAKNGSQYESARLSSPTRFSFAVYNAS